MTRTFTKTAWCEALEEDVEITIEEYTTKREIVKLIQEWKDSIKCYSADLYIAVQYEDGSYYFNHAGDEDGKFRYTHIKAVIMDDGCMYYAYGKYEINENADLDFEY
jgi:hypothetical protein